METFALAESQAFNFGKHRNFTDEDIKQALQKDLETSANVFTMPDGTTFDYNNFFDNDLPKDEGNLEKPDTAEDQPVPSIENSNAAQGDTLPGAAQADHEESSVAKGDVTENAVSSEQDSSTVQTTSSTEIPDFGGLKDDSADPLLFNFDGMEDFFAANEHDLPAFDEPVNTMPTLASPFQAPAHCPEPLPFDFSVNGPDSGVNTPQGQMIHHHHQQHLSSHHFPSGRRRSQTVPPDFEPGMSFQRRMGNGTHVPLNRSIHPQQSFPPQGPMRSRPRYGPDHPPMMGLPRSYSITPPSRHPHSGMIVHQPQHEYMGPSRPQSLNPDLRMSLMNRGRDLSPDRGSSRRGTKRQKQHHDRQSTYPGASSLLPIPVQEVDLGTYGLEQVMTGVEFMLRDAVEKVKYGRDEEVERSMTSTHSVTS